MSVDISDIEVIGSKDTNSDEVFKKPVEESNNSTSVKKLTSSTKKATSGKKKTTSSKSKKGKITKEKKKKRFSDSLAGSFLNLLMKIAIIAAIVFLLMRFVFGIYIMYGNTMHPAVADGDVIITYRLEDYEKGDLVSYNISDGYRIARIVAVEGETVDITPDGTLYIDGFIPAEQVFYGTEKLPSSTLEFPYTVPEGCVFLFYDYRTIGEDSRLFGAVNLKDLNGKSIFLIRRRGF